jgi:hypothetical protein
VAHGLVVEGGTWPDLKRLRILYTNCAHLAGDDGTGACAGADAEAGMPLGNAVAVVSSPVIWEHAADRLPVGDKDYHMSCVMRTYDYLYYRGIEAELAWATPDGQENTQSLEDTVTAYGWPFRVVDLTQCQGLAYGRLYFVRSEMASGSQNNVYIFEELRS